MSKPYKYPPKNVVWRLITYYNEGDQNTIPCAYCELIGRYNVQYSANEGPIYKIRYVKRPKPIILVDLDTEYNGLTIDGYSGVSPCELDPILHHEIVQRAVELAAATYNPQALSTLTGVGNVSSTNLGVIPQSKKD